MNRTCPTCGVLAGAPCLKRDGTPRRPHAGRDRGTDRYPRRRAVPIAPPLSHAMQRHGAR